MKLIKMKQPKKTEQKMRALAERRGDTEFKCVLLVAKNPEDERKILLYRNTKINCNIWAAVIHQTESTPNLNQV